MKFITLDFETYYDSKIKLGFKHQTTEEYIRDSRFEVIGVGLQVDDQEAVWYSGSHDEVGRFLAKYELNEATVLCHNTIFDGAILSWLFNIKPAFLFDTLCMARAIHGVDAGGSLKALAERYELGAKGEEVIAAEGKRRADFTPDELHRYGEYCKNDVDLTYRLFQRLSSAFPSDEFHLIDMTLRMFTEPMLHIDDALLTSRLTALQKEKSALLGDLVERLGCENEKEVRKKLSSNKQFAEILQSKGVEPPMKPNSKGKQIFAFAKTDEEFLELLKHEDTSVQQLCAVRLGVKSTIEETRIESFIDVGKRNEGRIPIPLKYYGAHTGRWGGDGGLNLQNLPSRDKAKKTLKNSMIPPEGYYVVNSDSSQIEARITAWLAGQDDVVERFAAKQDVYSLFASTIYGRKITKADETERFVGKTCVLGLGFGTGGRKLQHTLATARPKSVLLELEECTRIVNLYREENPKITELWDDGDMAIKDMLDWHGRKPYWYGVRNCVKITKDGIQLPNGLYIRYPNLRLDTSESRSQYYYDSRKGPMKLWGGVLIENVVQALARIVVGEQMLKIRQRYPVVLTVHDAAVTIVKKAEIDEALAYIVECMSTPPDWARGLPVACEAKFANSYGEC